MPKFMRSHDDAGETASVLDDGHAVHLVAKAQQSEEEKKQSTTVKRRRTTKKKTKHNSQNTENKKCIDHLLKALVDNTGASHISKACSSSVAVTALCLSSEGKMQI